MKKILININKTDSSLRKGLHILKDILPIDFSSGKSGVKIEFRKNKDGLKIKNTKETIIIHYAKKNQVFRALGIIAGRIRSNKPIKDIEETQYFDLINIMLDTSRNAAVNIHHLKKLLKYFALMGVNSLMLYTESNYEVPGEKFWGYNLGKYTIAELRELDAFADDLGIEMFPCIQTLAHLRRSLQWQEYFDVKDTQAVLLVGEEKTYKLIDKLIQAAVKPYKSKRIHIGMDEAWDLGLGNHLRKHGYRSKFEIMKKHLRKVLSIVNKYKLQPMMWSDMFFRTLSLTGDYYDPNIKFSKEVRNSIPKEVSLVYWDYYHTDKKPYRDFLAKHFEISKSPVAATGAYTWCRFWTDYISAFATIDPCMMVSKEKDIREVILTVWGDDGNECDYYSVLPVVQYFADHSFNCKINNENFENNLLGSCNIRFKEWEPAGSIDFFKNFSIPALNGNPSKCLLWEDLLFGTMQYLVKNLNLKAHYKNIAESLEKSIQNKKYFNQHLNLPYQLAKVLTVKWDLPSRIQSAYLSKDKDKLKVIINKDIPFLKREITKLWQLHRSLWFNIYKPHGWETLEARYGGAILRLETAKERLTAYISGEITVIEELEGKRLELFTLGRNQLRMFFYEHCYAGTLTPVN